VSDLNGNWSSSAIFLKILQYQISWKSVQRFLRWNMETDKQTEKTGSTCVHFTQRTQNNENFQLHFKFLSILFLDPGLFWATSVLKWRQQFSLVRDWFALGVRPTLIESLSKNLWLRILLVFYPSMLFQKQQVTSSFRIFLYLLLMVRKYAVSLDGTTPENDSQPITFKLINGFNRSVAYMNSYTTK
jgi:hypothetical protein